MKLAYDPQSLEEMLLVEQYLKDERNFAIKSEDWPRVSLFKEKLRVCNRRIVSLRLAMPAALRAA